MSEFTPFYCCYLLHSINKKQSFYIGSTPEPKKRLRQHNGSLVRGGAYRTKRLGTRPWEMVMIVYGFPNRITALQFEHAWQHGYQTHFINPEERVVKHKNGGRSLKHRLSLVRLLLKNQFFQRMNLKVHFFNKSTMDCWNKNEFKIDVDHVITEISVDALEDMKAKAGLSVDEVLDYAQKNQDLVSKVYNDDKETFDKAMAYFTDILSNGFLKCDLCQEEFDYTSENHDSKPFVAFCLNYTTCSFHCHLKCLSEKFLSKEDNGLDKFVPINGSCPRCQDIINWVDVVKYSCALNVKYGGKE